MTLETQMRCSISVFYFKYCFSVVMSVVNCTAAVPLHDLPWLPEQPKCLWDLLRPPSKWKWQVVDPFLESVSCDQRLSLSLLAWLKPIWQWGHITGDRWVGEDRPAFQRTHTHAHTQVERDLEKPAFIYLHFGSFTKCVFVCLYWTTFLTPLEYIV